MNPKVQATRFNESDERISSESDHLEKAPSLHYKRLATGIFQSKELARLILMEDQRSIYNPQVETSDWREDHQLSRMSRP